ncbi:MAG: hypothetical protein R3E31_04815 [Chloroflexota bacterium]
MSRATAAPPQSLTALERAIWQTVAYFDVFDYPLTAAEVHRYLEGVTARASDIAHTLANGRFSPQHLVHANGYYMFAGREHIVAKRQRRHALAQRLWPAAIRYGRFISSLPFVRMVAVTGSLAVNNVDEQADIDYLVVTENGRLWLCRAFIIAIVRLAARQQLTLCPNYLLSERVLQFSDRNLYTAHEVAQMIPLSGLATYQQMRQANLWTAAYIPNAIGPPTHVAPAPSRLIWANACSNFPGAPRSATGWSNGKCSVKSTNFRHMCSTMVKPTSPPTGAKDILTPTTNAP